MVSTNTVSMGSTVSMVNPNIPYRPNIPVDLPRLTLIPFTVHKGYHPTFRRFGTDFRILQKFEFTKPALIACDKGNGSVAVMDEIIKVQRFSENEQ